jgi:alpha-N-arabinofuranosidase
MQRAQDVPVITITKDLLYPERISPLIYGDFIEFINDLVPAMWADRLRDRAFAGPLQPVHTWPLDPDWSAPSWRPFVCRYPTLDAWPEAVSQLEMVQADATLDFDNELPFVGAQSARVTVEGTSGPPFIAGIAQRIAVRRGERLTLTLHARTREADLGPLTVLLGRNYGVYFRAYASAELGDLGAEWRELGATLACDVDDEAASLAIGIGRPGTFWLGRTSLMPEANERGWRPDVVAAVRAMRPGIIRFGGSSLIYYQWESGIGPRSSRVPFENRPWGNREDHDVGLHEFLDFCELVGAEPLICLNANSASLDQVMAEIEYCNGPAGSPYGRIRAEMGHPEPFNVRYWQIGNEQEGEEYERILAEYAAAIRAAHPQLVLLGSYPSPHILAGLSDHLDHICPHHYELAGEAELRGLIAEIRETARNRELKIGVTEWNHTAGQWGWARAWLQTLFNALNAARMFNAFQRLGDMVRIANRSNMTNSVFSGIIQTSGTDLYLTPCYHVQRAYATLSGDRALAVQAAPDEALDLSASSQDDGAVTLFCVNVAAVPQRRRVVVDGAGDLAAQVDVWTLTGPGLDAANSFVEKQRVAPVEATGRQEDGTLTYAFPPFSVTALRFHPWHRE